jgi:aerobic-type carbon monoxide dehydrogenase small subunit (CoxS/CutS family)
VHVGGVARRACVLPMEALKDAEVTTIEGLARGAALHPVQRAWQEDNVPQCGYCQPGQIMAAVDFLRRNPQPTDQDIRRQITNICRCGTYQRIRKAIRRAAEMLRNEPKA